MESWSQAIVEWINCLGFTERPISHIQQLQENNLFYSKIIKELKQVDSQENIDDNIQIRKFIENEYPKVLITNNDNTDNEPEQIYLASLLLLSASQKVSFHRPMYTLKNETQILIKQFLELILPYGKSVTFDTIRDTIFELSDITPMTPPQTPKDRPLKNFLTSPAAHSAYRHRMMNERTREFRVLKAQLETERFEKADLQQDLQTSENKIQSLQQKLKSKTEELKTLRMERTQPATPQSARKNKNNAFVEECLRKEVEQLELFNSKLQSDLDRIEGEHENLTRRLTSKERINGTLKEKVGEYEREMETLAMQLEMKTNELLDLRMQNEELRAHIKGMQKYPIDAEQSFEVEHVMRARSPTSGLNISEAASSIIDIQLRESYEESAKLKAELNCLQQKFDSVLDEYKELKLHNELLNEKIMMLDQVQMTLEMTEDKLSKRDCQLNIMEMGKKSLQEALEKLQGAIDDKDVILKNTNIKKSELESEITNLKENLNNLKISLVTTEDTLAQIVTSKEVLDMKTVSLEEKIKVLEESLAIKTTECFKITQISQDQIRELKESFITCSNEKQQLEERLILKNDEFVRIATDLAEKNSEINLLKSNVSRLENQLNLNQSALAETEIKLCELNELRDELQSQLMQERENAATLFTIKCELECNLSTVDTAKIKLLDQLSALQLDLNKLQHNYDDLRDKVEVSEEKYVKEKHRADSLHDSKENLAVELINANAEISQLKNIQENLQNRLTQEQESCMKLVTEKADLEHAIATSEHQNFDQFEQISILQSLIDKSQDELKQIHAKYNDCNINYAEANDKIQNFMETIEKTNCELDMLNKKILELEQNETCSKSELKTVHDNVEMLSAEKLALELALLSRDDEKKHLTTKMTTLQADLNASYEVIEKLKTNYEALQQKCKDDNEKIIFLSNEMEIIDAKGREIAQERKHLQEKVNDMTKELNVRETESKQFLLQIDELRQIKGRMVDSHQDHQNASNELIGSLEKRLLATQNTCETLKLDMKLQEESFAVLKSNLEKVTNEKNKSELKMKEVIVGLQEVRSSQEAVLKAQAKALSEKTSEFEILQMQYSKIKQELQTQLDLQKARNVESSNQCIDFKKIIDKNIEMIRELEQTRDEKNCRLKELQEECESMEADMHTIEDICNLLLRKNHEQDDKINLQQSFNHPVSENLAKKLKNMCAEVRTTNELVSRLQVENDNLQKNLENNKATIETVLIEEKKNTELTQLNSIDVEWNRRNTFLKNLIQQKENLLFSLKETIASRNELQDKLLRLRELWNAASCEVTKNIAVNSSACDELKHMEAKRMELGQSLNHLDDRHSKNLNPLMKVLDRVFIWSDKKIYEVFAVPLTKTEVDISEIDISDELSVLQMEIKTNEAMLEDLDVIQEKIDELRSVSNSYEENIKSGVVKREVTAEEKLQMQLERVTKEKKELKDKMDAARVRNAKMEKNMDELRSENKKMKSELYEISSKDNSELTRLTAQVEQLEKNIEDLKEEKAQLEKRPKEEDFGSRLKDIHNEYGQKLEKIKQRMKTAYGEQMAKLNIQQEKAMAEKVSLMRAKMEQQCKKYSEDIAKYKAHISDMSSQFWDVGEKLLAEKQEKEIAMQHLREFQKNHQIAMVEANQSLQSAFAHNQINSMNIGREFNHDRVNMPTRSSVRTVQLIEEQTTTTRRHSVKSIQAMGNAFSAEDEEGEVFDNVYLADLKEGKFRGVDSVSDFDRISELRMRNSLCRPHLKSSYAVETHFNPLGLTEEDIKSGPPNEDTFNDSLSQSLLPGQKTKKKDRTQTSYKRPGPPTPSKNGGRLSLQGNELKSPNSRILRERNTERRTTATPKRLKDFFATSLSRRQDENAPATPRGRRLSNIFRKTRAADKS